MKTKILMLALFCGISVLSYGQKKAEVSGRVTDENQNPVKKAMITVDEQRTGKSTDKNGYYKIRVDPSAKVIGVFAPDGRAAELPYNGNSEINFSLPVNFAGVDKPAAPVQGPEDDQVNIGYGTISRKNVTSSVSKVDSEKEKFVYKDIYEMLRGKPGVQVAGKKVTIQGGQNSFVSGTDPLFVVDGVVVNTIDDIVPATVRSIEILKGSSAAIYGSRGANGVILITLKK